jgi:hypothetical protein
MWWFSRLPSQCGELVCFFWVICQTRALATTVGQVIKHIQKGLIATRKQLDLSWPFPATSLKTMMN